MSKKYKASEDHGWEDVPPNTEILETPPALDSVEVPNSDESPKSLETVVVAPIKEYLALRVFATIAGPKWDQMAGFVSHARSKKLGPLTMEDWQAEFKKFQEKPVG